MEKVAHMEKKYEKQLKAHELRFAALEKEMRTKVAIAPLGEHRPSRILAEVMHKQRRLCDTSLASWFPACWCARCASALYPSPRVPERPHAPTSGHSTAWPCAAYNPTWTQRRTANTLRGWTRCVLLPQRAHRVWQCSTLYTVRPAY